MSRANQANHNNSNQTTATENPSTLPATTPQEKSAPATRDVFRSNRTFIHRIFRSSIEKGRKNVSYQPFRPKLEDFEHKHFFHTIDNRGRNLTQTDFGYGHYHKCEWGVDQNGNPVAKSGPPYRKVTKKLKDGSTAQVEELVGWEDASGNLVVDEHQHTWEYMGSDEISPTWISGVRESNARELAGMGVSADAKPLGQARPLTDKDGVSIS